MSSGKREAGSDLNHDNWNDEEKVEVAGDFKKATEDELLKRQMKVAKQSLPVDLSCSSSNIHDRGSTSSSSDERNESDPCEKSTEFSQQNYSCYTPPINSRNSYMTARDPKVAHSTTTQSTGYHLMHETPSDLTLNSMHYNVDSPQYQPHSIPTYSAAINARSMNNSTTHSTHSQQQITSITENHAGGMKTSPDDSDSNSWSGMDLTKRATEPTNSEGETNNAEGVSSSDSSSKAREIEQFK